MGYRQLYYTSCTEGLSGYAGFQFNAVSPGLDDQTRAAVERLAGYELPAALLSRDPAEIGEGPINLTYTPDADNRGPVLMRTCHVGPDYSGRPGNFFAHALVPANGSPPAGPPAIELWGAPFWTAIQSSGTELPELAPPLEPGPLSPAAVRAVVAAHPDGDRCTALATAAARALLDDGLPVLIVDEDTDRVAHWIAALCYLLPGPLVERLSFSTYQYRPRFSRAHVVGTIPGTDVDPRTDGASFAWFDFTRRHFDTIEPHPLPVLIDERVDDPAPLWRAAAPVLADCAEPTLDQWHAAVAFVWMASRPPVEDLRAPAVRAVADWGATLPAGDVERVATRLLEATRLTRAEAESLVPVLRARQLHGAADAAELVLLARSVDLLERGEAPPPVRLSSTAAHTRAGELLGPVLASAPASDRLAAADWALGSNLALPADLLFTFGRYTVGPMVIDEGRDLPVRWGDHDQVRLGVLSHADEVARTDPARVARLLRGPLAGRIGAAEREGLPALDDLLAIDEARAGRRSPVEVFDALVARRESGESDDRLARDAGWMVAELWPGGAWTVDEAYRILHVLDPARSPGLVPTLERWCAGAVQAHGRLDAPLVDLCRQLVATPALRAPAIAGQVVRFHDEYERLLQIANRPSSQQAKAVIELIGLVQRRAPLALDGAYDARVFTMVNRLQGSELAAFFQYSPPGIVDAYCRQRRAELSRPDIEVAMLELNRLAWMESRWPAIAERMEHEIHVPALSSWKKKDLDAIAERLRTSRGGLGLWYEKWREEKLTGALRRMIRRRGRDQ